MEADGCLVGFKSAKLREKIKNHPVLRESVDNLEIEARRKICTGERHTHKKA